MSILIKGMAMPKNCETCELYLTDSSGFFGCCVTGNIVMRKREQDRPSWCPLIEVPKHGRLIDADAIHFVRECCEDKEMDYVRRYSIDDAPTIIEAERGDNDG